MADTRTSKQRFAVTDAEARNDAARERAHFATTYTRPAMAGDYAAWLTGYLNTGRHTTHRYDYNLPSDWLVLTRRPLHVPSLYGAHAINVIVPADVDFRPADVPQTFHGQCGHSSFYFMNGFACRTRCVPVYADVEQEMR